MPCHAQPNPSAGERFERACVPQAGQCRGSDRGGPLGQVLQSSTPHPCLLSGGDREKGPPVGSGGRQLGRLRYVAVPSIIECVLEQNAGQGYQREPKIRAGRSLVGEGVEVIPRAPA